MKKVLFAIALCAITFAACNKEKEIQNTVNEKVTIRAFGEAYSEIDPNGVVTKGTLNASGNFFWAEGDQIGVRVYKGTEYLGTESVSGFTARDIAFNLDSGYNGQANGSFTSSESLDQWHHWGYAAYYPMFDSNIGGDGLVYFHLWPWHATYQYTSGTCLMPMMANLNIAPDGLEGRPSDISFKHVGAGLRVTLKNVPADANQASLTVPGKKICGWFGINPSKAGEDDGIIIATQSDNPDEQTIYLKFATDTQKRDITFIFPLPTVDLSGGVTLKLYYGNSYTEFWSKTASNLPALTRGQLLDMPEVTVPVTPEESAAPIWIDGKTHDWSSVTHTTTTSSNRILEWKYTQDDNNLYFLYKVDASKITADASGSYKWGSYFYIGFDTDNDATNGATASAASGGLGAGMEYRAVVFPWRGTTTTSLECFIGEDEDGHIDDLINNTTSSVKAKVGGKIVGSDCFVEVRIPRSAIGNPTGPITVKHAMNYYATEAKQIMPELVTINAADQTVGVGQSVDIGASSNSVNSINYSSGNESIAKVDDNGVITGIAQGSTTITLSVAAVPGEYTAATKTINVEVTAPYIPAIVIDGNLSDWSSITAAYDNSGNSRIREWRFKSDSKKVYFYLKLRKNRVDGAKNLYIGFDLDNDNTTGGSYGDITGCEAYIKAVPFTNSGEGSTPVPVEGVDTASEVKNVNSNNGVVSVWDYDDDSNNPLSSNSSNIWIELSAPREMLGLPAAGGTVTVGCSYGWGTTDKVVVTME